MAQPNIHFAHSRNLPNTDGYEMDLILSKRNDVELKENILTPLLTTLIVSTLDCKVRATIHCPT